MTIHGILQMCPGTFFFNHFLAYLLLCLQVSPSDTISSHHTPDLALNFEKMEESRTNNVLAIQTKHYVNLKHDQGFSPVSHLST